MAISKIYQEARLAIDGIFLGASIFQERNMGVQAAATFLKVDHLLLD